MNIYRIEVHNKHNQTESELQNKADKYLNIKIDHIQKAKIYWLASNTALTSDVIETISSEVLTDPVIEFSVSDNFESEFASAIEVSFKPGVTDNTAHSVKEAISIIYPELNLQVFTGSLYLIKGDVNQTDLDYFATQLLGNSLLQNFQFIQLKSENRFINQKVPKVDIKPKDVTSIDFNQDISKLQQLSTQNCWALNDNELLQIQEFFSQKDVQNQRQQLGLTPTPTDIEIEIIAQSWSEHCKHKIFSSHIEYSEDPNTDIKLGEKRVESLYKSFIKKATYDVKEARNLDWLISVFSDNAGIVRYDDQLDICVKVETHNSPSALDPYGGALTGILGVNRDILGCGVGSKPIANMDVFCLAHESLLDHQIELPVGLKHPKRILEGVHKGVEDGGNKSGIPTVNGSIFFDDSYAGKPLIYVGTVGAIAQKLSHYPDTSIKNQKPGDLIVMSGGAIGADGIHGATFSSLELNENSPATAVQIGDPFTQKKLLDFLIAARDRGLYSSVTDNGAGGLSSSIGEMAQQTNGAKIDLSLAPTKYPGLSAYELMISESQERMTFSVAPQKNEEFLELSKKYDVQSTVLGEFTSSGFLDIFYNEKRVAYLDLHFLHDSLKPMQLRAHFNPSLLSHNQTQWHKKDLRKDELDFKQSVKTLLSLPNIQSKESWVRQYDHEVQGATIGKPFIGKTRQGPSDAGVIWLKPHGASQDCGVAISNGLQPLYSHEDAYTMAIASVDEAVRNVVATGANPNKVSLLDNFCWPDPTIDSDDGRHKLAQLVRACHGLYDCATQYGMPFISGKDSMKNDFTGKFKDGSQVKISVVPTLLITAAAKLEKTSDLLSSDFKEAGHLIYFIGKAQENNYYYSEYTRAFKVDSIKKTSFNLEKNFERYQKIYQANHLLESCHDISEGGLITALIESCLGSNIGCKLVVDKPRPFYFNEPSGFIISIKKENQPQLENLFKDDALYLGETIKDPTLYIQDQLFELNQLRDAWRNQ